MKARVVGLVAALLLAPAVGSTIAYVQGISDRPFVTRPKPMTGLVGKCDGKILHRDHEDQFPPDCAWIERFTR